MRVQIGATPEPKPGYKTTEFWLTLLVTVLGALMASGIFNEDSPILKLVGVCLAALSQLGYSVGRIKVKNVSSKIIDNNVSVDVVNRLVERVLEYKQAQSNNGNDIDTTRPPDATD